MTIASDLAAVVALAQVDASKLHGVVHGPSTGPTSLVSTDAGDVKTLARITAEALAAAGAGVVPFAPPVAWATGLTAVVGPPATAVTYLGESYYCNTGHLTGATFAADSAKWTKFAAKGTDGDDAGGIVTTDGDLLTMVASVVTRLARGSAGQMLGVAGSALAWQAVPLPRGYLAGCGITNSAGDTTNDLDVAAGSVRDSTNAVNIVVPALAGKRLDAGWAAGAAAGMRNSAVSIADGTYHIYAVAKALGADPDIYAHTSTTVATVITALQAETGGGAYLYARRIFSIVRASSAIKQFVHNGDKVYQVEVEDFSATSTSTATLRTLSVPTGIVVQPLLTAWAVGGAANTTRAWAAPASNSALETTIIHADAGGTNIYQQNSFVGPPTNASGQIYVRVPNLSGSGNFKLYTHGYVDRRGQDD